ncbi:MAG: hypothetical protein MJ175_13315, partial [Clostridia bacterium]|nr:hypothetical protein [Clostridia bacterium]
ADKAIQVPFETDAVVGAVRAYSRNYISVERDDGSTETDVFVQVRKYDDGFGMVLLNTDREHGKDALTVKIACGAPMHCALWDMESGKRYNADSLVSYDGKLLSARFSLAAAGTIAFVMTAKENGYEAIPAVSEKAVTVHTVKGEFPYRLNEKNVCVLDFARWKWEGGEWSSEAEILKCDQQVRDSIGIERRGGEMLQPWYAKLHDTKNYGHLTVEYTFDIETMPTTPVFLAGERPERISYAINGVKLTSPDVHDFWIDDCFKRMPVPADTLKTGRNVITADVEFMRTTNLEALYLIGDFGVKTEGHKRALATLPAVIGCENLDRCALPFYTGELTYILTADRYADLVKGAEKVTLSPTAFTGSLVKVSWEGADEKLLCWDPYTADVTEAVKAGKDILVTVVGTRRNLFGPLHLVPAIHGAYGPGHFVTEGGSWSDDYVFIDSGLTGIDLTVTE